MRTKQEREMVEFCFARIEENGISDFAKKGVVKRWCNGMDRYRTYAVLRDDGMTEKVWVGVSGAEGERDNSYVSIQGSVNYFPWPTYPTSRFGKYFSLDYVAMANNWSVYLGPDWYKCGTNKLDIAEKLEPFCQAARKFIRPTLEAFTLELMSDPFLQKGGGIAAEIRNGREMEPEDIVRELRTVGEEPLDDSAEESKRAVADYCNKHGRKVPSHFEILAGIILDYGLKKG